MFFGKGDTLEQWLREKDPESFKTWDGYAMRVYAVKTKAQSQQDMLCVVLVNNNVVPFLHRVYVVTPAGKRLMKGDEELWKKFKREYLPEVFPETNLDNGEPGPILDRDSGND